MNLSRRDLLKLGAGAAALWCTGARAARLGADEAGEKNPMASAVSSVRDIAGKDVHRCTRRRPPPHQTSAGLVGKGS